MTKNMLVAFLIVAFVATLTPASAQEQLRVFILDRIGPATLDRDGYGCFDPVAALRFDEDVIAGEISSATEDAFAVGACVVLESGAPIEGAQRVSIKNRVIVRGAVADGNVTAYLPDWSASLAGVENGYDDARMSVAAPVQQIAAALHMRVAAFQQCYDEGAALETRIANYNERAEEADPDQSEVVTGSRLVRDGGAFPVFKVYLPNEKFRALREEALQLQQDIEEYWARCEEYREPITLDKDYLTFFEATG